MTDGVVVEVREPGRVALRLIVVDRLPIGRAGDGLLLADTALSRLHCELRAGPDGLTVRDLGSSNGTTCNGQPVREERRVRAGDVVRIGETDVIIDPDGAADVDQLALTETIVRSPVRPDAAVREADLHGSIALVAADVMSSPAPVSPTSFGCRWSATPSPWCSATSSTPRR